MPPAEAIAFIALAILGIGVGCLLFVSFHMAGKRAEQIFPQLSEQDILFREREVSGTVKGSLAGASNALEVTVTRDELHIKGIYPLFTGLGEGRNWINVCASDALIAVGGGFGTLSEIALALKARKPLVLLGSWQFEMEGVSPTVPRARDAAHAVELAFAALDSARG